MRLRHSVMIGMLGRIFDRFHEYQPARDLQERLELAKRVRGANGVEVVYPSDFADVVQSLKMIQDSGLKVSALNLNVKSEKKWQSGSFTSSDPQLRCDAVDDLKTALDLAAELEAGMVTCCPLIDGHNYSFQADYLKQWAWLEEGIKEGASHRADIRLSMEYKLNESRNYNILADVGRTLYLCECIGWPHVGVTVDLGHAFVAKETPAEAMCLAAQAERLFYVHFNDNAREWDWDMLPGAVNFWDLLEVVFYLDRLNWEGWLSYDVVTRSGDVVESMEASIAVVNMAIELMQKLGPDRLQGYIDEGIPARALQGIMRSLL
jgi:xylose isomerase